MFSNSVKHFHCFEHFVISQLFPLVSKLTKLWFAWNSCTGSQVTATTEGEGSGSTGWKTTMRLLIPGLPMILLHSSTCVYSQWLPSKHCLAEEFGCFGQKVWPEWVFWGKRVRKHKCCQIRKPYISWKGHPTILLKQGFEKEIKKVVFERNLLLLAGKLPGLFESSCFQTWSFSLNFWP